MAAAGGGGTGSGSGSGSGSVTGSGGGVSAPAPAPAPAQSSEPPRKKTLIVVNDLSDTFKLEEAFRVLAGTDAPGATISADDIGLVLKRLGYDPKPDALRRAFRGITNNHERINYSKFKVLMQAQETRTDNEYTELLSYFTLLDETGTGRITPQALKLAFTLCKPPLSDQQFNDMIHLIKPGTDGTLSYRELIAKLLSNKD